MTALNCAVLTISDSRTLKEDTSGALLAELIGADGHNLADRNLVRDDVYQVRAVVSAWIADPEIQVVVSTGGTGFTGAALVERLLEDGHDVTVLDNKPGLILDDLRRKGADVTIGSVTDREVVAKGVAGAAVVLHLAAAFGASNWYLKADAIEETDEIAFF